MHPEVLDPKRKRLLPRLQFLNEYGFYLAGGTALALQIGHRTSVDFDFYTTRSFEPVALLADVRQKVRHAESKSIGKGTLFVVVEGNIELSFFEYPYPLLKPPLTYRFVDLASLEDIAAMKVIAIAQRGLRRDFVDLYFLSKQFGLFKIITATLEKYKGYDVYGIFRALCYFEDADKTIDRPYTLFEPVEWEEVKSFILKEVKHAQKLF